MSIMTTIHGTRKLVFALFLGMAAIGFVGCGGAATDEAPPTTGNEAVEAQQKYQDIQAKEASAGKTP